jgi:DNA-directed RNA polymerase subunit RPC12/RpoP
MVPRAPGFGVRAATVACVPTWLNVVIAVAIGYAIWKVGIATLRSASGGTLPSEQPTPEDVGDLDVFFVCAECGTEFQVTRLGEATVPRHCGEKMQVVRRPAAGA